MSPRAEGRGDAALRMLLESGLEGRRKVKVWGGRGGGQRECSRVNSWGTREMTAQRNFTV